MPLLDHFHPPLYPRRGWESVHAMWLACLTEALNEQWLPEGYYADVQTHNDRVEIDVATYEAARYATRSDRGTTTISRAPAWAPPAAAGTFSVVFPDTFEVRISSVELGDKLVGAVELVSESNKDRPAERLAFASKCASLLSQGVSLAIIDVVTSRRANLHNELVGLMEAAASSLLPASSSLYAVAYRPAVRNDKAEIDYWPHVFALGDSLPTLPLRLRGDLFVPLELEETYKEACRRLRLA